MTACPDYEAWCAYVDGSLNTLQSAALRAHLQDCDRCFATVVRVRRAIAEVEGEATQAIGATEKGMFGWRRALVAAAAVLTVAWMGVWQYGRQTDAPAVEEEAASDRIGFAGSAVSPLRGPVRVLVVPVTDPAVEAGLPGWGPDLFGPAGLRATCGSTVANLSVTGEVLPPSATRLPMAAYGESRRLVEEVLLAVDAEVNLADFDADGDGVVDFVVLVVAGGEHEPRGLGVDYQSQDLAATGTPIRISGAPARGALIGSATPEATICQRLRQAAR